MDVRIRWGITIWWLAVMAWAPAVQAAGPIVPPAAVDVVEPVLPDGTPQANVSVRLLLTIDTEGKVAEVVVAAGDDDDVYTRAAIDAAKRSTFQPATQDGEAITVQVEVPYHFRKPTRRGRGVAARAARRDIEPAPGFVFAGQVVEQGTRTPQPGIPVTIVDDRTRHRWEVVTDADGRFVAHGLPAGSLTLDIFTGEYRQLKKTVRVRASTAEQAVAEDQSFYLVPGGDSAYRTIVREKRPPRAATVIDLTEDEVRRVAGTFGDPTRVVASLPGVSRSPFGLGYYVVRGAEFDNTGFYIDGHPAQYLYHLLGGPGVIHPELVGGLSFYPGGYPARYGRYAAGIIAIETKDPARDRWHLDVELDLFRAGILFSVPFDDKKGIVTASFRRSYYELLLPLFSDEIELFFTDYQVRTSYDFSDTVRGRFVVLGAEDGLGARDSGPADGGPGSSADLTTGFHRVNLAFEVDLAKQLTWTNSAVWEIDHIENQLVSEGSAPIKADVQLWFMQLMSFVKASPMKGLRLEAGLDALYYEMDADLEIPAGSSPFGDPRPPTFDPITFTTRLAAPGWSLAPYVSAEIEIVEGLKLLPGLRVDFTQYGGGVRVTADPKLAVRWQVDPKWTIKAMAALAHQPPAPFQAEEPFGDPSVPMVEGLQVSAGFEWKPDDDWLISVEGFVQSLDQLLQPSDTIVGDDGDSLGRVYFEPTLKGRAFGLELLVRKAFGGSIYGWLTYTLSRAERDRADGRGFNLYELDQTHILNLAWTVRLGSEWSLGARFQLTSGNPVYPIIGARYDADRDQYVAILSDKRDRLPVYHRLDVRLDKRWRFDDWMFELYLDIQNLYNAQNPESRSYNYDYTTRGEGLSLPFLPTLGIRAVF